MVLDIILPLVVQLITDPVNKYVVTPVKRHVSYAFKSDSKIQELQDQVEQLQNKKLRLQQSVDGATRNGDRIFPYVTEWLKTAEKDMEEAVKILQKKEDAKSKCFLGFCPKLQTRYHLSKNAEKNSLAIDKLCSEQGLDLVSFRPPLQQIAKPSLYTLEALPSRVLMLNRVMDALGDPNFDTVGVYGMGGVGKTTLAKEVQAKALQEKLFEAVVLVTVSQGLDLRRIQGEIADILGIKFSVEEIPGRAVQLRRRLENSKVLIILDDLCEKLDFNAIGIPSQGSFNCKIMLTSRDKDLVSEAQKILSLDPLKDEETLSMFQMLVAEARDPKLHATATQIAKKCAGLPLVIQLVATELKNKESYVWKDMLNRLISADKKMYKVVYDALATSYHYLPEEETKSFLLLCALFGQSNIQIQCLLVYSVGLGLFKRIRTIEEVRYRVLTLIDRLKSKSLLLDGDMEGCVKMHDIVRHITLHNNSSGEQPAFVGTGEVRLGDWPNKECKLISLPFCNIRELPVDLYHPEAEFFLLFTEDPSPEIPDTFFNGMKNLKVVDLTGANLVPLPSSVGLLTSLRTLSLHRCQLANVGIVGELKLLECLSFANSNVAELPREIGHLTQLKLLDLRSCSNLQVIPSSVLSKLSLLEELYVIDSFVKWNSVGNADISELNSLPNLLSLEIEIRDPTMIPMGFQCFSQLRRFKISIGNVWDWKGHYKRSKTLKLKVENGVRLEDGVGFLLRESEDLYLDGVRGIERVFYDGFPQLKHLHVENDYHIQHLIKSTRQTFCDAFPALESLYLTNAQKLEKICFSQLGIGTFGELQILKISNCDKLTALLSRSFSKCFKKLRELEVKSCENMEAVVGEGSESMYHNNEVIEFTHLSSLKLKKLPNLLNFCDLQDESEQMGLLFSTMVSFPSLRSLEVNECNNLKHIFAASMEAVVHEIIENVHQNRAAMNFTRLSYLKLKKLPCLTGFCKLKEESEQEGLLFGSVVSLPSLTSLEVNGCGSLKHIFTTSMVKCLAQLKNLKIKDCELNEEMIQSKIIEEIQEETLVFPKLDSLSLINLKNMTRFCSFPSFKLPLPRELTVEMVNIPNSDPDTSLRERELLEDLQPHPNIEKISLKNYKEDKLPSWMLSGGDSFAGLNTLVDLKLEWCYNCVQLPSLGNLPHLKNLEMSHLRKVRCIDNDFYGVENEGSSNGCSRFFPALQSLSLTWMENLTEWSSPSNSKTAVVFPCLEKLSIWYCPKLTGFPLSDLSALVNLEIKDCQELRLVIGEKKSFASLSGLSFTACSKLTRLRNWLQPVESFEELKVTKCEWLEFVPHDLQTVSNLTSLEIYCCRRLRYFPEDILSKLTKLQRLSIGAFSEELDDFGYLNRIKDLRCLEELEIWGSDFLGREMCCLPNQLQHLSALKSLKVMGFTAMEALPEWLTNLQSLRSLSLDHCRNLGFESTATVVQRLQNILHLKVGSCPILEGSESEWVQHLHCRKVEVEISHS